MEIKFENIYYKKFKKLNFEIPENGITGITGSERTTLLNLISGEEVLQGKMVYQGEILSNKNKSTITKSISVIEQNFKNKYSKSTIEEYMLYMIYYHKLKIRDPKKKIIDSLKIVGLDKSYLDRNINTLSTSEKKLMQVAIGLIKNPQLILLEEPFINLDIKKEKKLYRLLTRLNEKYKICIVISSYDSEILYKYTKHLIILKKYKVLKEGNTKEIYENIKFLQKEEIEIPDIVLFTYIAKTTKKVKIDYHRDIRDLIKDIYKHI